MTKRDYIFIANIISQARQELPASSEAFSGAKHVARELAHVFAQHNAAFDPRRFMVNCGFEKQ